MTIVRRDIWKLGETWHPTIFWYAKAVAELGTRPIVQKTSWRYLAAMHGIDRSRWIQLRYLENTDPLPSAAEQARYWQQCQHQTWYFLPWHRAYLASLEAVVRAAVQQLGGPDDWALPYWNYSDSQNPNAVMLPAAFKEPRLPDGKSNPLFVEQRYGESVDPEDVRLDGRISENNFEGADTGVVPGIGGPKTPFSHFGEAEGLIEAAPHDLVHTDIGGRGGLMSSPDTAALDPVFWIHHANIDRLWEVWRARDNGNKNPTANGWLNGPADRAFAMFDGAGHDVLCTPGAILDTKKLGYEYDDISDPLGGAERRAGRLAAFQSFSPGVQQKTAEVNQGMSPPTKVELLGASDTRLLLGSAPATTSVQVASQPKARLTGSFTTAAIRPDTPDEPDRVYLNLENIRGKNGAAKFDVFLRPKQTSQSDALGVKVGTFSLFGLEQASDPDGPHGGSGLTKVLEVTDAIDAMHMQNQLTSGAIDVSVLPRSDVREDDGISIGQVSLYRQSGTP
jgi:tyrosinase